MVSEKLYRNALIKSDWSFYSYGNVFYLLVKMRTLSRNGSGQGIEFGRVDKIITYCFIEWNNMI